MRVELHEKFINSGTFKRCSNLSRSVQTRAAIFMGGDFSNLLCADIFAPFIFFFILIIKIHLSKTDQCSDLSHCAHASFAERGHICIHETINMYSCARRCASARWQISASNELAWGYVRAVSVCHCYGPFLRRGERHRLKPYCVLYANRVT